MVANFDILFLMVASFDIIISDSHFNLMEFKINIILLVKYLQFFFRILIFKFEVLILDLILYFF